MGEVTKTGKALRAQDHLGLDVELTRKDLGPDQWAYKMLREVGLSLQQPDFEYMGSLAVHFYKSKNSVMVTADAKYSLDTIHQLAIGELNEYIANMGLGNLMVELKRYYGRRHNTVDKRDQRGQ